jgi:hypothetical protein
MAEDTAGRDFFGEVVGGQAARVLETGIALLHKDEIVLPAAGSEAVAELAASDERTVINYYFPVEIEIRGGTEEPDPKEALDSALYAFVSGLQNIA